MEGNSGMKTLLILLLPLALIGCGLKGELKQPPPRDPEQRAAYEAAKKEEEEKKKAQTPTTP
jgi:predicted small lipoprotein YifL